MRPDTIAALRQSRAAEPHRRFVPLPGQARFEASTARRVIWFGFNGAGKTMSLCRRIIAVAEGRDPCLSGVRPHPLRVLLCVTGFEAQSTIDIARQLHELSPPGLFAQVDVAEDGKTASYARPWYGAGRGFRGRPPRLVVQRGPWAGTVVNVTTLGAGAQHSAGGTIDILAINEPITREVWDELAGRDRVGALGVLWYVFTPTPAAPSQEWVEEVVSNAPADSLDYIETPLVEGAYSIPTGGDGSEVEYEGQRLVVVASRDLEPWTKTEARIKAWSEHSRPQRMGLSLRPFLEETYFSRVWTSDVFDDFPAPGGYLVAGLDYSTKDGRTRVVVAKWWAAGFPREFWGHVVVDLKATRSDPDTVARELLDELALRGIPLEAIDAWIGDRAAVADRGLVRRDNLAFRAAILQELRRRTGNSSARMPEALYRIATPRKRGGSSWAAKAFIRSMLSSRPPRLKLTSYSTHLAEDFERWDGRDKSPNKDGLDALGYGAEVGARHLGLWTALE